MASVNRLYAFLASVPSNATPSPLKHAPSVKHFASAEAHEDDPVVSAAPVKHELPTEPVASKKIGDLKTLRARAAAGSNQDEEEAGEAAAMRRVHPRRVSTDGHRTMRKKALRDIGIDTKLNAVHSFTTTSDRLLLLVDEDAVRFFSSLRVPTLSRKTALDQQQPQHQASPVCATSAGDNNSDPRVDPLALLQVFARGDAVAVDTALAILKQATALLNNEPNVLSLDAPYTSTLPSLVLSLACVCCH